MPACAFACPGGPGKLDGREHAAFVGNLGLGSAVVRESLAREWGAFRSNRVISPDSIASFMASRYGRAEWHLGR